MILGGYGISQRPGKEFATVVRLGWGCLCDEKEREANSRLPVGSNDPGLRLTVGKPGEQISIPTVLNPDLGRDGGSRDQAEVLR